LCSCALMHVADQKTKWTTFRRMAHLSLQLQSGWILHWNEWFSEVSTWHLGECTVVRYFKLKIIHLCYSESHPRRVCEKSNGRIWNHWVLNSFSSSSFFCVNK
jgi:hypothetical protein